jgi:hypothetical protein
MVERKARQSRGQEPVQGSGPRPESARGVCGGSPQKCLVTWLSHKTGGFTSGDGIWARREASMPEARGGIIGLGVGGRGLRQQRGRAMKRNLSAMGSVVFCLAWRDSYILAPGFSGKPSFWTASHFLAPQV